MLPAATQSAPKKVMATVLMSNHKRRKKRRKRRRRRKNICCNHIYNFKLLQNSTTVILRSQRSLVSHMINLIWISVAAIIVSVSRMMNLIQIGSIVVLVPCTIMNWIWFWEIFCNSSPSSFWRVLHQRSKCQALLWGSSVLKSYYYLDCKRSLLLIFGCWCIL